MVINGTVQKQEQQRSDHERCEKIFEIFCQLSCMDAKKFVIEELLSVYRCENECFTREGEELVNFYGRERKAAHERLNPQIKYQSSQPSKKRSWKKLFLF